MSKQAIKRSEACGMLERLLSQVNIPGSNSFRTLEEFKNGQIETIYLKYRVGYRVECNVDVWLEDNKFQCLVNWPSASRTVTNAMANVHLYSQVVSLAAQIECLLSGYDTIIDG